MTLTAFIVQTALLRRGASRSLGEAKLPDVEVGAASLADGGDKEDQKGLNEKDSMMDTLLPGYFLRPGPSPKKGQEPKAGSTGDHSVCSGVSSKRAPQKKCSTERKNAYDHWDYSEVQVDLTCFVPNDAIARFTVPDFFVYLEKCFDVLWSVDAFLGSVKLSTSWQNMKACIPSVSDFSFVSLRQLASASECIVSLDTSSSCDLHGTGFNETCSYCAETVVVNLRDPWKARLEEVPKVFKANFKDRVVSLHNQQSDSETRKIPGLRSQKRIRQAWILRKCIINHLFNGFVHYSKLSYSPQGLVLHHSCDDPGKCIYTRGDWLEINWSAAENSNSFNLQRNETVAAMGNIGRESEEKSQQCGHAQPQTVKKFAPCTLDVQVRKAKGTIEAPNMFLVTIALRNIEARCLINADGA